MPMNRFRNFWQEDRLLGRWFLMVFGDPEGSVCGWKLGEMHRYNGKLPAANSESENYL